MILPLMKNIEHSAPYLFRYIAVVTTIFIFAGVRADGALKQKTFATPEEAVTAVISAARNNNDKELIAIFGNSAKDLIFSGDPVSDKHRREILLSAYAEKNGLVEENGDMVVVIGKDDWPFPVPLVKKGDAWLFDTDKGREEVLNRRIGMNELDTIQTMLAIVDAQREYAMQDRDGDGLLEYASKIRSEPVKQNGLYWETKEGEAPSPLGELVAHARAEGYTPKGTKENPVPYHGYYYQLLTSQGKNAMGGKYDYLVKGKLVGGFAVVAYPAKYGNSGVMTFLVNHEGVVYEKDLGKNTAKQAKAIKKYDPDKTWAACQ